ncbi:hypothetical protein HDU76_000674 [Blyttiomyces sp. JEL0837]|nr:hypothetical protein HDU76_000674 [Blyttiomyces sp. JEL0837]
MSNTGRNVIIATTVVAIVTAIIGAYVTNSYSWLKATESGITINVGFFSARTCDSSESNCEVYNLKCNAQDKADGADFCGQYNAGRGLLAFADLLGFAAVVCAACLLKWRQNKILQYTVIGGFALAAIFYFVVLSLAATIKDKLSNYSGLSFDYGVARTVDIVVGILALGTAGLAGYTSTVLSKEAIVSKKE